MDIKVYNIEQHLYSKLKKMRYWDITIWTLDQYYLDKLANNFNINYYDAEIYIDENTNGVNVANQLFDFVLSEAIEQLDISEDNKEYLKTKIHLNCIDSGINKIHLNCIDGGRDIPLEEVDDLVDGTDEEKKIIKDFLEKI